MGKKPWKKTYSNFLSKYAKKKYLEHFPFDFITRARDQYMVIAAFKSQDYYCFFSYVNPD